MLEQYDYIKCAPFCGDVRADVERLLTDNGKASTFAHVSRVADVCAALSVQFGADREKCVFGGLLHDVSAVIRPADMLAFTEESGSTLCEAERRYPFLLHQRLSVVIAKSHFGVDDADVLSAIECHTTLKENASVYDMILFTADKLAWDQEGVPPFYDAVTAALGESLEKACLVYMRYMEESGKLLCPHTNWIAGRRWLENRI